MLGGWCGARRPTRIELTNSIVIEVTTNDRRRVRGRTVIAAIFDEVAHWRSENTQNPDKEVYRAVKPAMVTMPEALLIGISSPYARRGLLWDKHEAHWGKPGRTLVVKSADLGDEPDGAARPSGHRGRLRHRSVLGRRRVWRRVPNRCRNLRLTRSS